MVSEGDFHRMCIRIIVITISVCSFFGIRATTTMTMTTRMKHCGDQCTIHIFGRYRHLTEHFSSGYFFAVFRWCYLIFFVRSSSSSRRYCLCVSVSMFPKLWCSAKKPKRRTWILLFVVGIWYGWDMIFRVCWDLLRKYSAAKHHWNSSRIILVTFAHCIKSMGKFFRPSNSSTTTNSSYYWYLFWILFFAVVAVFFCIAHHSEHFRCIPIILVPFFALYIYT